MLQTVIGSPVKGGGAPASIDDEEEMPQIQPFMPMLPPAESEAGPSQPMGDSPGEMPDDDEDPPALEAMESSGEALSGDSEAMDSEAMESGDEA